MIIFYDTETTGLPDFKAPSESEHQPHIVQLAALLVDPATGKTINSIDVIIKPDGWIIPDDVTEIHGISTELAMDVGVSEKLALEMFMDMWGGRKRVGHNESFDARIIRIGLMRYGSDLAEVFKAGEAECTMRLSTKACGLGKAPKLSEAYRHFVNEELENAHSAMADALACRDIYFSIKNQAEAS